MIELLHPTWSAPASIAACSTTRLGGVSQLPYAALNLGAHVGDDPAAVKHNRQLLLQEAHLPAMPHWLEQVHGTKVLHLTDITPTPADLQADAVYTRQRGQVCAVMTADCLPVLFCSQAGDEVAAAHAGWRGLCGGVLENTIAQFSCAPASLLAWLGPAIGPRKFEVGCEVRDAFMQQHPQSQQAFTPCGEKYLADIYQLARLRLHAAGVDNVYGGEFCTMTDSEHFFSYRRERITGRLASLIWLI